MPNGWKDCREQKMQKNNYNGIYHIKTNVDEIPFAMKFSSKTTIRQQYDILFTTGRFECPKCGHRITSDTEYCVECGLYNDFRTIKKFRGRFHPSDGYPSAGDYVFGQLTKL